MKNLTTRLSVAITLVVLVYAGAYAMQGMMGATLVLSTRDYTTMPTEFGQWHGKEVELDPKVFARIGADVVVDREYRNDEGRTISVHTAIFSDPDEGVYHSPMNCYRANGYEKVAEEYWPIQVEGRPEIQIKMVRWKKKDSHVLMAYWYRLGEHTVFSRAGLGWLRLKTGGGSAWPAMTKVLLQTSAKKDLVDAEDALQEMAAHMHGWLEEPEDQPQPDVASEQLSAASL